MLNVDTLNWGFDDKLTFEPGDIVGLVVGGPDMVVLSSTDGMVEVAWAEEGRIAHAVFPEEALIDV